MKVRVGVLGYGTIGARVADAIAKQPDMVLIGVSKRTPDYRAEAAVRRGYALFVPKNSIPAFEEYGISVAGSVEDLLRQVDVIVDATPKGVGAKNKPLYQQFGVKAVFEGGEKHEVAGVSFVAQCNYEEALDKQFVRVVSCNTTGLCRTLGALDGKYGVEHVFAVIIRRARDPDKADTKGVINTVVLDPVSIPSHHAPDVRTVLKHLPIVTTAVKVPTTYMHVHAIMVLLRNPPSNVESVIETFEEAPRIIVRGSREGIVSTATALGYVRELGRLRDDLYEILVLRESITLKGNRLYYTQFVHQEADVIPENIDAIRAITSLSDRESSIRTTNQTLSILDR
ncbi:type II glyceraldehyde-3-phosphate dehydrogenase [archaeon]|nr:type II glyceraldehyde-3-phosphate dehydrogenase [archaeon]